MDPALVIRRELPGDEQPTRALHEAAFGVPAEAVDRCAEVEISSTACAPTVTSWTR